MISTVGSYFPVPLPFFRKKSPFEGLKTVTELEKLLSNSNLEQWLSWKKEIRDFISCHASEKEELDRLLTALTKYGFEKNPQMLSAFIVEIISLDLLTEIVKEKQSIKSFHNIKNLAAENAKYCEKTAHLPTSSEWQRYRPLVLYFIPNLLNLFLGAFNFLDIRKKYTTLWEKYLLIEIVYKFFVVPYVLFKILEPFIDVTAKVYVATVAIIVGVGLLLSIYQRWLRPIPDEIVNCRNLDKLMSKGTIEQKVGETKELNRLIESLSIDQNVILIGKTGEGKTSLVHHLVALKHQKKLPEKLQKLSIFEVSCGGLMSTVNYGHAELISQLKEQCEGFDEKILFFFDDFGQISEDKKAFETFKTKFLEEKPHSKFIATITLSNFQDILKKLDTDGSFEQRVDPIVIQCSDDQMKLILGDLKERQAKKIPVSADAIKKTIELSSKNDYLPSTGRPAKAIKIFNRAIGRCLSAFSADFVSPQLMQARKELKCIKKDSGEIAAVPDSLKEQVRKKEAEIHSLEKELAKNIRQAQVIKKLVESQNEMNRKYRHLSHDFPQRAHIHQQEQILYLWLSFYARSSIETLIQAEIKKVRAHLPVQVDENLIQEMYEELKEVKNNVQGILTPPASTPQPAAATPAPVKKVNTDEILDDGKKP